MKLYEIENYLEKKVRFKDHDEGFYIYFEKGCWINSRGKHFYMSPIEAEYGCWEEYTEPEPPKVKRYWQWIVCITSFYRPDQYIDESGVTSSGVTFYKDWEDIIKVKIENEWVDIDDKGKIVNWSPK